MLSRAYADEICEVGRAAGLDRVGVASAEPFVDARVVLDQRKAAGLAGSMQFTYRNPGRSTDPDRALAGVAALVVGARRYDREVLDPPAAARGSAPGWPATPPPTTTASSGGASTSWPSAWRPTAGRPAWCSTTTPWSIGLPPTGPRSGWFGKNANILVPGLGSWVVLGSVLTTAPLPPADEVVADGCGTCRRCLDGCPTGAIVEPGVVDARRCLAWLVQAEGVFPDEHRVALGDRLYGCDDCQEVCPPSRPQPGRHPVPDEPVPDEPVPRRPRAGSTPSTCWRPTTLRSWPASVAGTSRVASPGTCVATPWSCWATPPRPALPPCAGPSPRALAGGDALVAAHAVWAARRLGADDLVAAAVADGSLDAHDPQVRAELDRGVAVRADA